MLSLLLLNYTIRKYQTSNNNPEDPGGYMKKNITIALFIVSCAMPIFGMENKGFVQSNPQIITGESLKEELVMFHAIESLPIYSSPPAYPIRVSVIENHLARCVSEECLINKHFAVTNVNQSYRFPTVRPRINRCIEKKIAYDLMQKEFFLFSFVRTD